MEICGPGAVGWGLDILATGCLAEAERDVRPIGNCAWLGPDG